MSQTWIQNASLPVTVSVVVALTGAAGGAADTPLERLADSGLAGGLVLQIGAPNGPLQADFAELGPFLLHALALNDDVRDAARAEIASRGVYGLATVVTWHDRRRLPYATNLATAVIADVDTLGAVVPRSELERILAPGGTLLLRECNDWKVVHKQRPVEIDDWTHFDHGPDGNPVSRDTVVTPIRQQQWRSGVQPNPFEGNPAGYSPGGGIRLWDRFAVMDVNDAYTEARRGKRDTWSLQCRDAFNGVLLWSLPRDRFVSQKRWSLVAACDEVYAWLGRERGLVALDIRSGDIVRSYAGTEPGRGGLKDETFFLRVTPTTLVAGLRDRVLAFDRKSTEPRWTVSPDGKILVGGVIDEPRGRLYCLVARPGARREFGGRWPHSKETEALLALDLDTGEERWRCDGIASRPLVGEKPTRRGPGQIVPAGQYVIVFGSAAISGGERPYIASIDAETGKLLHESDEPFRRNYNVAAYNLLWRDGAAWFAGAFTNVWRFEPATGAVERVLTSPWNQRCTRFTATTDYFLFGQTAYYDRDLGGVQMCIARSGCAMGSIPANGMTYFTPTACGCITQVRGFQAMTGEAAPSRLADDRRLVRGGAEPTVVPAYQPASLPPGLVASDWTKQRRAGHLATPPVAVGDLELVAVVHQHRLEARQGGKTAWAFVADARISSPPVVVGDAAIFGAHDGWIYAVDHQRGELLWKYLLAPTERYVCVHGQLESSWPVYGVCLSSDEPPLVIASAGTHVELDGGVTIAALDAATGKPQWTKRLQKPPSVVPPGGKGAQIVGYSFLNSVPRIEDGEIVLGDGGRRGGRFAFRSEDSEDQLHTRLASPPKKRR